MEWQLGYSNTSVHTLLIPRNNEFYCSLYSSCENVIPESDDLLCLRCECNYESRNTALIAVSIYLYSGNYYCLTLAIFHSIRACGRSFVISSDKMADQRSRKKYVPRQAQKDPETVTNNDEDTRSEFTLNDWDEGCDSLHFSLVAARSQEMELYKVDSYVHGHHVFRGATTRRTASL